MGSIGRRLVDALTSPWTVGFSAFGLAYGGYILIDATQSGKKYDLDVDLTGKTYIVTGATSGIGRALAQKLANQNARVIMACRNREKCLEVRRDIVLTARNKQVYCRSCDLSNFDSIQEFVTKLSKGKFEIDRVDGLVNNAAVMLPMRDIFPNGIEKTLETNHLGTFLLTGLLLDKLLKQDHPSRILFVNTNTVTKENLELDLDKLNNADESTKYDGYDTYKNSKLAELVFAKELAERLKGTNVSVVVADPGRTKSALQSQMPAQKFFLSRWVLGVVSFFMGERKTVKAIRPLLYALADPETENKNGIFYDRERQEQPWGPNAENEVLRRRLWAMSERWTYFRERYERLSAEIAAEAVAQKGDDTLAKKDASKSQRSWMWLWLR